MKLPDSRVFLVRFSERMDPAASPSGEPIGRIEHVESGLRAPFSSLEEMRGFIVKVLAQEAVVDGEERSL